MDLWQIELVVGLVLTVVGWELGRQIWASKGADPDRGRWYGAALCFLFGALGLLTLIGIGVRWHPASEAPVGDAAPSHPPISILRAGLLGLTAIVGAVAIVAVLGFAADAMRYGSWSDALPPGEPVMTRADCTRVTGDWDACYVPHAARRTAQDWRTDWDDRRFGATGAAVLGVAVAVIACVAFVRLRRTGRREADRAAALATSPATRWSWDLIDDPLVGKAPDPTPDPGAAEPPPPASVGPVAPVEPLPTSGGPP